MSSQKTKMKANEYPENWESEPIHWRDRISVHFGYAQAGWITLSILPAGRGDGATADLSYVYSPFTDMLGWLEKIAEGEVPLSFDIDQEGSIKRFIVRPYHGNSCKDDIEFRIVWFSYDESEENGETCFLTRLTRRELLNEFVYRFEEWRKNDYDPDEWDFYGMDTDEKEDASNKGLKNIVLQNLKEKIRNIPLKENWSEENIKKAERKFVSEISVSEPQVSDLKEMVNISKTSIYKDDLLQTWKEREKIPITQWCKPRRRDDFIKRKMAVLIRKILKTIEEQRFLRFEYFGGSEPGMVREITPESLFRLLEKEDIFYLSGYCHLRKDVRVFRLDKMRKAQIRPSTYQNF
jgi:hypothetical protein